MQCCRTKGAAWDLVAAGAAEFRTDDSGDANAFFVRLRPLGWGGTSLSGAVMTEATKGHARLFCKRYGLAQSLTITLGRVDEVDAVTIASEWCDKMQFFYSVYAGQADPSYVFTDDDRRRYREGTAFASLCDRLHSTDAAFSRATLVRLLAPARPEG